MNCQGKLSFQTYTPEHYSIELAKNQQYDVFFDQEMQMRRTRQYPPYYYVVLVTVSHPELLKAVQVTEKIVGHLTDALFAANDGVRTGCFSNSKDKR